MNKTLSLLLGLAFILAPAAANAAKLSDAEYAKLRKEARERKRKIILNNDGCDVMYFPRHWEINKENFLKMRTSFLAGKCDTLMYCPISAGQGNFTLPLEGADFLTSAPPRKECLNIAGILVKRNEDYFQWLLDFCKENKMELFFCFRFNDTHDSGHRPDKPNTFFSKFKDQNRHLLFGKDHNFNPRFSWWTAFDYSKQEVRNRQLALTRAILDKYDVDGIDLDFSRYLKIFPSTGNGIPASQEELDMMTDLVRQTRKIIDEKGKERGKAILLSVVLPDSVKMCKNLGYDVEKWFAEGLIDIWQQHDGGQISAISENAAFAHKYGVRYYAFSGAPYPWVGLSKGSLLNRASPAGFKGRINNAIEGGADGLYLYNVSNSGNFKITTGDVNPQASYFVTPFAWEIFRGSAFSPEDYDEYQGLNDHIKCTISPGVTHSYDVEINKLPAADTPVVCYIDRIDGAAENISVSINGVKLAPAINRGRYESFTVPAKILKKGLNKIELTSVKNSGEAITLLNAKELKDFNTRFYTANAAALKSDAPGVFTVTGGSGHAGLVKTFANEEFTKLVVRFSAKLEKGSAFIHLANRFRAWNIEMQKDKIVFADVNRSAAVDTAVKHDYEVIISGNTAELKIDGKTVLSDVQHINALSDSVLTLIPVKSRLYGSSARAIFGVKEKSSGVVEFSGISISNPPGSTQITNLMIECQSPELIPAIPENLRRNAPGIIGKRSLDGRALPFAMSTGKEFVASEITITPGDRRSIWVVSNGKHVAAWTITRDGVALWQVSAPQIALNNGNVTDKYVTMFENDQAVIYRNGRLFYRTGESFAFTYDRGAHICTPEIVDVETFLAKHKRWFTKDEREVILKGGAFVRGLRENTEMSIGKLHSLSLFEK